jgi:hypothetical protein
VEERRREIKQGPRYRHDDAMFYQQTKADKHRFSSVIASLFASLFARIFASIFATPSIFAIIFASVFAIIIFASMVRDDGYYTASALLHAPSHRTYIVFWGPKWGSRDTRSHATLNNSKKLSRFSHPSFSLFCVAPRAVSQYEVQHS